jgi:hypothetical protein
LSKFLILDPSFSVFFHSFLINFSVYFCSLSRRDVFVGFNIFPKLMIFVRRTLYPCSPSRRELFVGCNILVQQVNESYFLNTMFYFPELKIFIPRTSSSNSRQDVFLGCNILIHRVEHICSSDTIFLFPEYTRCVYLR